MRVRALSRGLVDPHWRWRGENVIWVTATRNLWIRVHMEIDDELDELQHLISHDLALVPSLTANGARTALERCQLYQRARSALRQFKLRLSAQYRQMAVTGKPLEAEGAASSLAEIREALEKTQLVQGFIAEADKLRQELDEGG